MRRRRRARASRRRSVVFLAAVAVPVGFVAVFFAYPLLAILARGFAPDGNLDLSTFGDVLGASRSQRVIWFTFWQAAVSTIVTLALGLPGAYALARFRFPGSRAVAALVTVPFVLPTIAVGAAFLAIGGPGGPFGALDLVPSVAAVIVAHAFFNYAVVVRAVGGFWSQMDQRVVEAARTLGASRRRAFTTVTLPMLSPAILAAATIVFLFTFTSFGVVLLLAPTNRRTIEVEIYRQTVAFLDLPTAAVLVAIQLVGVVAVVAWLGRVQRRRSVALRSGSAIGSKRAPRTLGERCFVGANLGVMALLLGTPIVALVSRSLSVGDGWGVDWYEALGDAGRGTTRFTAPWDAVRNSLVYATTATVLAVTIGGLAALVLARRFRGAQAIDVFLMLPLGTSAVTIGFGFLIALDSPPLDLRTSPAIIPIAHAVVAIPFVVRIVLPGLRSIDPCLRDAARTLGASPVRVWWAVDLPIVGRALGVAAGFAFAISLGEFGATAFITRPEHTTVPVAIFRALGRPGAESFGTAMALSVVLMVIVAAAVLAVDRLSDRDLREL